MIITKKVYMLFHPHSERWLCYDNLSDMAWDQGWKKLPELNSFGEAEKDGKFIKTASKRIFRYEEEFNIANKL